MKIDEIAINSFKMCVFVFVIACVFLCFCMYSYGCVYVCVCVCAYGCVSVRMDVCMCVFVCVRMGVCMCVLAWVRMCVYARVCIVTFDTKPTRHNHVICQIILQFIVDTITHTDLPFSIQR